ncbi:MAG: CocE/NonD family hydrolase, partial [Candidatus Lokiarchaeota archaeon]|nr:CocE/NonD family hydrolase [Candidatus Lokiarchaeota archaeon]
RLYAKEIMGNILFRMIAQKDIDFGGLLYDEYNNGKGVGNIMNYYYNPLYAIYNDPIDSSPALLKLKEMAELKDDPERLTSLINEKFGTDFDFSKPDTDENLKKFLSMAIFERKLDLSYRFLPYAFGFTGENVSTPMLCIGSWYDMFIEKMLLDINDIQEKSPEYFKKNFKMIIGPGAHGGMDFFCIPYPPQLLPLPFGKYLRKVLALYKEFFHFDWYEHWLNKEESSDLSNVPAFKMWIMNKQVWRYSNKWPPETKEVKFYLHSGGNANSRFGDGVLSKTKPKNEPCDEFDFNPADPVNTRGGRFLFLRSGMLNQSEIEKRKDILIYSTEKLKEGIEILGEVKLIFYASSSAVDTDFTVKLVDVHNESKILHVIDSGVRARYRESLENPKLLEPDKIYKYEVYIGSTGIYFPKGHKIRIEISSSNFPRFNINSNLAGKKSEKGYTIAHQKIYHDSEHKSHLILPTFPGS